MTAPITQGTERIASGAHEEGDVSSTLRAMTVVDPVAIDAAVASLLEELRPIAP